VRELEELMVFLINKKNFLDFIRNLTPQILIGTITASRFVDVRVRSLTWEDAAIIAGGLIFFTAAVAANLFTLVDDIKNNYKEKHNDQNPPRSKLIIPVLIALALMYCSLIAAMWVSIQAAIRAARCAI
jgi:heme A synthase